MQWLSAPPSDSSKRRRIVSTRKKYILFCNEKRKFPLFPLTLIDLLRYVAYLPDNKIQSGWDGVKIYVAAAVQWNVSLGYPDPRLEIPELWAMVRTRFKDEVQIVRRAPRKLPLQRGHITAMVLDAIDGGWRHAAARDITIYILLWFSGLRIGHVAPKTLSDSRHVLRWRDLKFLPSIATADTVLIFCRSTKTRSVKVARPWWTAVGAIDNPIVCPVRRLRQWFATNFRGDRDATVFPDVGRTAFIRDLRTRLVLAAPRLNVDPALFDPRHYAGLSFRKGAGSALSGQTPTNRVMDHLDHAALSSTRQYVEDTVTSRAANSRLMAEGFATLSDMVAATRR